MAQTEVTSLRMALKPLEAEAKKQPWDKKRPWRVATHVGAEDGLLVVDLHDLKAKVARRVTQATVDQGAPDAGALVFVVGRGRHSMGAGGVLDKVVISAVGAACKSHPGWMVRRVGPARVAWITDRKRAPRSVTGGGGWGISLIFLGVAIAFGLAVARTLGWTSF